MSARSTIISGYYNFYFISTVHPSSRFEHLSLRLFCWQASELNWCPQSSESLVRVVKWGVYSSFKSLVLERVRVMCKLYFYAGDPLAFKSPSDGSEVKVNERDGAGMFVADGWRCLCTLFLHSSDQNGIKTESFRSARRESIPLDSFDEDDSLSGKPPLLPLASKVPLAYLSSHSQRSGIGASSRISKASSDSVDDGNCEVSSVSRTCKYNNGDEIEERMGMENGQAVTDSGCEGQTSSNNMSPVRCPDGTASSQDWDDETTSIISDAEVQDRLLEPGLTIELDRLLLRKPTTIHYPAPRRVVLLQDPSIGDEEVLPKAADERIFGYQKVIHTVDPLLSLWKAIDNKIDWGAARILEKRGDDNLDPFIFLNHRYDFSELLNDPLASDNDFPVEITDAIEEQWERLIARYGAFDVLQMEQRLFIDKLYNILFHYQEAVAGHSLVTKDAVSSLLSLINGAMREYFAIDYGFRVSAIDQLTDAGGCDNEI